MESETTRRAFMAGVGAMSAAAAVGSACAHDAAPAAGGAAASAAAAAGAGGPRPKPAPRNYAPDLGDVKLAMTGPIPRRPLGKTGVQVSLLCLGGYHLGTVASAAEAMRLVHESLDHGLDFFDNAWEYHDGKSEAWLGAALRGRRQQAFVMTKVCTHGRDAKVAMTMLEESLARLGTDHVDLWQVHECIYDNDPELHHATGGVLEALVAAKRAGKARLVGFTGHKHPSIHLDMLARGFAFDTCQLPLNPFDGAGFRSFEREVLPVLAQRGIAALGMKTMGGEGDPVKRGALSAAEALGYAMSLPVASVVCGVDSLGVLRQNLNLAGGFRAWEPAELDALRSRVEPFAADGRFELYKTSKKFDGPPGREQHGYPPLEELGG